MAKMNVFEKNGKSYKMTTNKSGEQVECEVKQCKCGVWLAKRSFKSAAHQRSKMHQDWVKKNYRAIEVNENYIQKMKELEKIKEELEQLEKQMKWTEEDEKILKDSQEVEKNYLERIKTAWQQGVKTVSASTPEDVVSTKKTKPKKSAAAKKVSQEKAAEALVLLEKYNQEEEKKMPAQEDEGVQEEKQNEMPSEPEPTVQEPAAPQELTLLEEQQLVLSRTNICKEPLPDKPRKRIKQVSKLPHPNTWTAPLRGAPKEVKVAFLQNTRNPYLLKHGMDALSDLICAKYEFQDKGLDPIPKPLFAEEFEGLGEGDPIGLCVNIEEFDPYKHLRFPRWERHPPKVLFKWMSANLEKNRDYEGGHCYRHGWCMWCGIDTNWGALACDHTICTPCAKAQSRRQRGWLDCWICEKTTTREYYPSSDEEDN